MPTLMMTVIVEMTVRPPPGTQSRGALLLSSGHYAQPTTISVIIITVAITSIVIMNIVIIALLMINHSHSHCCYYYHGHDHCDYSMTMITMYAASGAWRAYGRVSHALCLINSDDDCNCE